MDYRHEQFDPPEGEVDRGLWQVHFPLDVSDKAAFQRAAAPVVVPAPSLRNTRGLHDGQEVPSTPASKPQRQVRLLDPRLVTSAVVDVASVPERHDDDKEDIVFDRVDDAVVANPDSQPRPSAQRPRSWGTGVLGQQSDGALNATSDGRVELLERPEGGRAKLDAVGHVQPRSALA